MKKSTFSRIAVSSFNGLIIFGGLLLCGIRGVELCCIFIVVALIICGLQTWHERNVEVEALGGKG